MKKNFLKSSLFGIASLALLTSNFQGTLSSAKALESSTMDKSLTSDITITPELKFIMPANGTISQNYHEGHHGLDIANPKKSEIVAARQGVVVKTYSECGEVSPDCGEGEGNYILIDHGNGMQTFYAHLKSLNVKVGDQVEQGATIGKIGRTGKVYGPTGIHLHFEVRINGIAENPKNYLLINNET